ncbi:MAG: NAD(P)H-quinone oxidoreductase [Clostridiales bacterium]|nr:NAD(P)H-quinone oxidoreductase [Clostridiales bacterium]
MATMEAYVLESYGGPEVLQRKAIPLPEPQGDEVRVQVKAVGINRADLLQRRGRYPQPGEKPPFEVPGLEFAGIVEKAAPGAHVHLKELGLQVGSPVMGLLSGGAYAQFVVTHPRLLLPLPEGLSFTQGAAIPEAYLTAWDGLLQGGFSLGKAVLIPAGGSGVGVAATQLVKAGGGTAITLSRTPRKVELSRDVGADRALLVGTDDVAREVREATGGRGVDLVLELVAGPHLVEHLQLLSPKGTVVVIGTLGGGEVSLPLGLLMAKRARLVGTLMRSRPLEEKMDLVQRFSREILPLFASGTLVPRVHEVVPWEEGPRAHQILEENQNFGKVVLEVAS